MKLSQTNGIGLRLFDDSIRSSLKMLRDAGFRYVDVSFFTRFTRGSRYWGDPKPIIDEYLRSFDEFGMTPVQSHEPTGNSLGDDGGEYYMKKTPIAMMLASSIGCPSITVHPGNNPSLVSVDEIVEKNIVALKKLIPYAEKYQIRVLVENMTNFKPVCADELIAIVDGVNHPLFGVCWDVGHGNINGLDQYTELTKLGPRLQGLHLHDNVGWAAPDRVGTYSGNYDLHLPPFYGNINYDSIMNALFAVGYRGTFNFEADGPMVRPGRLPLTAEGTVDKSMGITVPIRAKAEALLYEIGKYILTSYDCFEE